MERAVLILGAGSAMARALARRLASQGHDLVLAGRDLDELGRIAADVGVRSGRRVECVAFDALAFEGHEAMAARCWELAGPGGLHAVVDCHGVMPPQEEAFRDAAAARRMVDSNFTSAVTVLNRFAAGFEARGSGLLVAVGSVAGDRGRQSNFLYGASKAGLATYLEGLRHRLARAGVAVITVKPGFVDTAMTFALLKPGSPLTATPERVARDIHRAMLRRSAVIYTPWFWRWVMCVIRCVPRFIFHKTRL
jgi:short-subunit dehydrogenase